MAFGTDVANDILDLYFNTNAAYVSLHTGDPGTTGADEVTGGTYARQEYVVDAAASKLVSNTGVITFEGMPECSVTHVGWWTASSGGDFIYGKSLVTPKDFEPLDEAEFAIGDLDFGLA